MLTKGVVRETGSRPMGPVLVAAFTFLLHGPLSANAQVVRGQVVDATTETGVPAAEISLVGADGMLHSSVRTDSVGTFIIGTPEPGNYRLEVQRIGYEEVATDLLRLRADSVVYLVIRLATDAVTLEPLEVIGRRESHSNRATFEGLYERRAQAPSVGWNRIWVSTDPEMDQLRTLGGFLRDQRILREGPTPRPDHPASLRHGCIPVLLWRGTEIRPGRRTVVLEMYLDEFEGIEVYRELTSAPPAIRPERSGRCGFVVVWPRRRGDEPW